MSRPSLISSSSHSNLSSLSDAHRSASPNGYHHPLVSSATVSHLKPVEDHPHYPCSADDYDICQEIGIGAFATVFRGVVRETGEEVAIKVIDLDQFNTNWEEIRREILVMSLLHHPNVVPIKCSFVDGQDLWIVMPLLEAGSCAAIMKQIAPNGFRDEALIATILKETLQGLQYFHKDGRIHRDLKAGNILIGWNGSVELGDFGVAGTLMENGDRKRNVQTFTGSLCWMAPEVMEHSAGYDEKADIWSLGITALELAFGRAPYSKFQPMKVILITLQEDPPSFTTYKDSTCQFSECFQNFIRKCLTKDPTKRPTAKKLLEHKFIRLAKDKNYIVDKIVKKLPPLEPIKEKIHVCKEKSLMDKQKMEKSKPISVGSWSFDKEEYEAFKKTAMEDEDYKEVARANAVNKAVAASYHDEANSDDSPCGTPGEDGPRGMPAFEPPHIVDAQESDQIGDIPNVLDAPGEHQQGRFHVSDEDETLAPHVQNMAVTDSPQLGAIRFPTSHEDVPSQSRSEINLARNGDQDPNEGEGESAFPEFHDMQPQSDPVITHDDGQHVHFNLDDGNREPEHVGRFEICDEDDD